MKKLLINLLIIPYFTFAQNISSINIIHFEQSLSWDQILQKARLEKKPIFVDVYATWCMPCKKMDENVYNQEKIATYYNDNYISVKVQLDSNLLDDKNIKRFYNDAKKIIQENNVKELPTLLFFSSNGELMYRDKGFKNASELLGLGKNAMNFKKQLFDKIYEYKTGIINPDSLENLFFSVKEQGLKSLADSIANDYADYLNTYENFDSLITKNKLFFYEVNLELIKSSDKIINYITRNQLLSDSIMNFSGWSEMLMNYVITNREIFPKISHKNHDGELDWDKISLDLGKRYKDLNTDKILLTAKITYYRKNDDWINYAKFRNIFNTKFPPKNDAESIFFQLNIPAWDAFLYCNYTDVLTEALKWSELSISLCSSLETKFQCLDTRSNLLYKLGKIEDAIAKEKELITFVEDYSIKTSKNMDYILNDYKLVLKDMLLKKITWNTK